MILSSTIAKHCCLVRHAGLDPASRDFFDWVNLPSPEIQRRWIPRMLSGYDG